MHSRDFVIKGRTVWALNLYIHVRPPGSIKRKQPELVLPLAELHRRQNSLSDLIRSRSPWQGLCPGSLRAWGTEPGTPQAAQGLATLVFGKLPSLFLARFLSLKKSLY